MQGRRLSTYNQTTWFAFAVLVFDKTVLVDSNFNAHKSSWHGINFERFFRFTLDNLTYLLTVRCLKEPVIEAFLLADLHLHIVVWKPAGWWSTNRGWLLQAWVCASLPLNRFSTSSTVVIHIHYLDRIIPFSLAKIFFGAIKEIPG